MVRIAPSVKALVAAAVLAGLVAAFFAVHSNGASGSSSQRRVVKTAMNASLGETVLVSRKGLTLYSLSVERRGKFICTNSFCLSLWTPLVVPKGTKPTGVSGLGTVKRPDGRIQVTYHGGPLYTFKMDRRPGDVKGNGFKDVGIWRAASVGRMATPAPTPTGGYGGGYGR